MYVDGYNNTIHFMAGRRPGDVFLVGLQACSKINMELGQLFCKNVKERNDLINKKSASRRRYKEGDGVYVKIRNIKAQNKAV